MIRQRFLARGVGALLVAAALAACTETKDLVNPPPPSDPMFQVYVSLGNSLTAGYQSGGINDSTQMESYPVQLAQLMGTPFSVPELQMPGCPPPIDNFLTLTRVGGGSGSTCALRTNSQGLRVINDVAVPGAWSGDPFSTSTYASNPLTMLILGGKTQVQRALDANPTFASVWIGNNDALPWALSGLVNPIVDPGTGAVLWPGLTPQAVFAANLDTTMTDLTAGGSLKGGLLIGVVDVTNAPLFFAANLLFVPQVKGAVDQVVGTTVTVDTSCTPTTTALINFQLLGLMRAGEQPDTIACHPLANHAPFSLGDTLVLDPAEVTEVSNAVAGYNAAIQAEAQTLGWAYADPNPALAQLKSSGAVPPFPDLTNPAQPYGPYISIDGIHPALAGDQLLAGLFATAIDAQYGTHIAPAPRRVH